MGLAELGVFSDEVFSSTDLNRKAGEVLNRARKGPVTIARNNERFALLRREQAASMVQGITRMAAVSGLAQGVLALQRNEPQAIAPEIAWIRALDEQDRLAMLREVFDACVAAYAGESSEGWEKVGDVIHEWRESAAVAASGVLREAMESEKDEVALTEPGSGS